MNSPRRIRHLAAALAAGAALALTAGGAAAALRGSHSAGGSGFSGAAGSGPAGGVGGAPRPARGSAVPPRRSGPAEEYLPGRVVVGYLPRLTAPAADAGTAAHAPVAPRAEMARMTGTHSSRPVVDPAPHLLVLPRGLSVTAAIRSLHRRRDVAFAVPDFVAHVSDAEWIPDDRGRVHTRRGWERAQWNFLPGAGVNAPVAWAHLRAEGRPGGRGVVVAILDTGVAYRRWRGFRRSPDFSGTRFKAPYDFVAHNRFPLDREGHGTFVAGTVAETTDNGFALTGLAYGATIMPVRVLDAEGNGDAVTIADGIRYAVTHGAQVINLSLEFTPDVTARDIPEIMSAIRFADRRGVVVVAASGNEGADNVAYPARAQTVISVGATTRDRCLADYSNTGSGLDLVAPGGGDDAYLPGDPNCHTERNLPSIYQMSFGDPAHPNRFGYPSGMFGTSMATPHVAAAAALVIASGVIGPRPTPAQIKGRLEDTAQPLGPRHPNSTYGYGLLDAGAATAVVVSTTNKTGS